MSAKLARRQEDMFQRMRSPRRKPIAYRQVIPNLEPRKRIPHGWVYVIRIKEGPVKIGISISDVRARLKQIDYQIPYPTEILGILEVKDPGTLERQIHWKLESYCIKGEWFNLDERQIAELFEVYGFKNYDDYWRDSIRAIRDRDSASKEVEP